MESTHVRRGCHFPQVQYSVQIRTNELEASLHAGIAHQRIADLTVHNCVSRINVRSERVCEGSWIGDRTLALSHQMRIQRAHD